MVQHPIYFVIKVVSKVLNDSNVRYFQIQKIFYALLITSCKLKHYFQSHPIEVHTSFTLGDVLHNREATGSIAKWVVELDRYGIIHASIDD